ncbi:MAG: dTDP-4-dehydrorhamnose 3,5-epimerase [Micrococcales bacterium 73-13]|nr:MAG: dTDP-4-dehydrorhamnose 3,5-epimerase [Micrococcales bacterium 73-13]
MRLRELSIAGAWEAVPTIHSDGRGAFLESYRSDALAEAIGHRFDLAQMNVSASRRGVVRGVHYADVPPGQAKYVQCLRGSILDVVVDLRVGSPTFGAWDGVRLDDVRRSAVYVSEGLGHAFVALEDDTTVAYLVSEAYHPEREHGVSPLDAQLAIDFGLPPGELVLSDKDRDAPTLAEALRRGALPDYEVVRAHIGRLAGR